MKNKKFIVLAIILIILIGYYLFLRLNPPLHSSGMSYNSYDPYTIVIELENDGFGGIKIQDVLVNNLEPKSTEIGISHSNQMVTISEVREASEGVSFHDIQEITIKKPPQTVGDEDFDTIQHYALAVYHNQEIQNVKLKYKYLGIPFELDVDASQLQEKETGQKKYSFTYNGQTFHLHPYFEELLHYTSFINANPDASKKDAFDQFVIEPFNEHAPVDLSYSMLGMHLSSTTNIGQLEQNTLVLLESESHIIDLIKEAIIQSADLLPMEGDTNIYLFPLDPNDFFVLHNMEGVAGIAYYGNNIGISIDPSYNEEALQYGVAHEYHHVADLSYNGILATSNVLNFTLLEGKADAFAQIVYPEFQAPWTEPLSSENESAVIEILKEHGNSTDMSIYNQLRSGWSNYKIGNQIITSYIQNNPDKSILEWTQLDPKEIVLGSDYSNIVD
ncbi:DUF2268 domain-containing protein [Ornithinibacillus californiensis]|uniref:DUF2268 domain-containing protein n=1 Tax=Ornithinibacillus californiensis TaxID=161536 RepID=UPI00064D8196|nr:DUF2268 domain-containing putative Zn-dependent protease [Ornithinibacillus californiensis]